MKKTVFYFLSLLLALTGQSKSMHTSSSKTFDQNRKVNDPPPLLKTKGVTISGYITEEGSGELLAGVSVYVPNLNLGTVTNDYGFFSLSLPEGEHTIFISHIGFSTKQRKLSLTTDRSIDVALSRTIAALKEVVVTAGQKVKASKTIQMSTVRLNPLDIQDAPTLLGEKDALKTLQLLPGIQGGTEGNSGFFVRGGTPDQNMVILDGAVVYNSSHLFGFFSVFNGDAIKSVEAFKGGFPARFGGRLSSMIKIETKDGNKEKLSGKINLGIISSSLLLEGPIKKGKTSFLLGGRRTYADLLSPIFQTTTTTDKSGYYFGDLNFKIHHILSSTDKLYWSNYFGRDQFYAKYNDGIGTEKIRLGWGNITSTIRWNHQFTNKLFSNTSFVFSNYDFKITSENEENTAFRNEEFSFSSGSGINDFTLKTDFEYYASSTHSIRFGAMATRHNFIPQRVLRKDDFVGNLKQIQRLNSFDSALYMEDDWKLNDRIQISSGLRVSYFNYKNTNYFNPETRLALAYTVKSDLALKASYTKMNQYIHLLSGSGIGLPTDLWVSSTDKVKPQSSQQFALGLAKDFFDKDYSLTVEGYYKTMDDVIAYKEGASFIAANEIDTEKTTDWEENVTSGQGWAYGTEVLFRKQTGKFTGWLGYTLSWSEREFEELNFGRKFFDRYDRRHDISVVGIYKPHERLTLSANWVFATGNNYTLPDLSTLETDIGFGIQPESYLSSDGPIKEFATARNNFRGESSHRLDLGIQWHKKLKKNKERSWGVSLYNAYARQNPFVYSIESTRFDFDDPDALPTKELTRTSVLVFVPSINYTLKF